MVGRSQRPAEEAGGTDEDLDFRPGILCGGKLSKSDYNLRSRKCTDEQLALLKSSTEFQAWEKRQPTTGAARYQARTTAFLRSPRFVSAAKVAAAVITLAFVVAIPKLGQKPSTTVTEPAAPSPVSSPMPVPPQPSIPPAKLIDEQVHSRTEVSHLQEELRKQKMRADSLAADLRRARVDAAVAADALPKLESELAEEKARADSLAAELNDKASMEASSLLELQAELDRQRARADSLAADAAALPRLRSELAEERARARSLSESLKKARMEEEDASSSDASPKLRAQLAEERARAEALEKMLANARDLVAAAEKKRKELQVKLVAATTAVDNRVPQLTLLWHWPRFLSAFFPTKAYGVPPEDASNSFEARSRQYTAASLAFRIGGRTLPIDAVLLILEICALATCASLAAWTVRRYKLATKSARGQYLAAYRRQQSVLALAEDAYSHARSIVVGAEQRAAEIIAQAEERAVSTSDASENARTAALQASAAQANAVRARQMEADVAAEREKVKVLEAQAAARGSSWASAAARILQLSQSPGKPAATKQTEDVEDKGTSTPSKEAKTPKSSGHRATPPSPTTLADAVAARYAELRRRAEAATEAAATSAVAAEAARQEQKRSEDKVTEMVADTELLKDRLEDAKRAFAEAQAAHKAAEARATELAAALDDAKKSLAAVEAQRSSLQAQAEALERQLDEAAEKLKMSGRSNASLEAQVEQLTASLGAEAAAKAELERRCAAVQADLSSLQVLAEGLQAQRDQLERELVEARTLCDDMKAVSQQQGRLAAALQHSQPSLEMGTHVQDGDHALQLDDQAYREILQEGGRSTGPDADLAPAPVLPSLRARTDRLTPPPSARASSLSNRVGQIASLLADGLDGVLSASNDLPTPVPGALWTPPSATTAAASRAGARRSHDSAGSTLSGRLSRAWELITKTERLLGQTLPGDDDAVAGYVSAGGEHGEDPRRSLGSKMQGTRMLPYIDIATYTQDGEEKDEKDVDKARLAAAVRAAAFEVERIRGALMAFGNAEAAQAAAALESAQSSANKALIDADEASKHAASLRQQHARLAAEARAKQAAMEDAQKAMKAAMHFAKDVDEIGNIPQGGGAADNKNSEHIVAASAEALQAAEAAQASAAKAVYEAEQSLHRAVMEKSMAWDAVHRQKIALEDAMSSATRVVQKGSHGNGMHQREDGAVSVSPRGMLAPAEAVAALIDVRFKGGPEPIMSRKVLASSAGSSPRGPDVLAS